MGIKEHGFFRTVELCNKVFKHAGVFAAGKVNRNRFLQALKRAHPFVFDRTTTHEKRFLGRSSTYISKSTDPDIVNEMQMLDVQQLAEDFSLPFSTSLYLMTDPPGLIAPQFQGSKETAQFTLYGYLIEELTPETFLCWEVCECELEGQILPYIHEFTIDVRLIENTIRQAKALGFEVFNAHTDAHVLKETASILNFTDCISVKRIGIEHPRPFNIKTKGVGVGITTLKYDNIIHIADKVEYDYVKPLDEAAINWEHVGFWRGHWRAFYVKDSIGDTRKDERGWNMVDYGRLGKDRKGDYNTPGYTWVVDHVRGNKEIAEIKTRTVKHDSRAVDNSPNAGRLMEAIRFGKDNK